MRFFLGLILSFALLSCASQKDKVVHVPLPEKLEIQFGAGGGMTGMWTGYSIQRNGVVEKWQGRTAGSNPTEVGKLSEEELQNLWNALQADSIYAQSTSEAGNMTSFIHIKSDDNEHSIRWPQGANAESFLVENKLLKACESLIQKHQF